MSSTLLHLDPWAGAAGDMTLGAFLDVGLDPAVLHEVAATVPFGDVSIDIERLEVGGIAATDVQVRVGGITEHEHAHGEHPDHHHHHHHAHRSLREIQDIVGELALPESVRARSLAIFETLGRAEAAVHGKTLDEIHFHEVGAADAIIDIVGAAAGIEALAPTRITASPLPIGNGYFKCAHGTLAVPGPAFLEIVRQTGAPTRPTNFEGELVTPTGAAIIATVADAFGPPPSMVIDAVGYGAGDSRYDDRPNVMRVLRGRPYPGDADADEILVETNVDDMSPELTAWLCVRLLEHAADVWTTPVVMKKGRPGVVVSALCRTEDRDRVIDVFLRESRAIGVRTTPVSRHKLPRRSVTLETPYGDVRMKVSGPEDAPLTASPEYEDCRRLAEESGAPLDAVYNAAIAAFARRP